MSRYMDIDKQVYCGIDGDYERYNIDPNAPSIDIVRCKECSKRKKNRFCLEHMRYERDDNGFCSYGKRSE